MDVTPPTPTPTGGRSAAHQMVLQMFYAKFPVGLFTQLATPIHLVFSISARNIHAQLATC
jgi:hypothetical protein